MDYLAKQRLIHQIKNAIDSLPDVREEKVAFLRQQIRNSCYRPDPDDIARRMVAESLQEMPWQDMKPQARRQ